MRQETYYKLMEILNMYPKPLTTIEVAEAIHLSRSVTSLYPNELLER